MERPPPQYLYDSHDTDSGNAWAAKKMAAKGAGKVTQDAPASSAMTSVGAYRQTLQDDHDNITSGIGTALLATLLLAIGWRAWRNLRPLFAQLRNVCSETVPLGSPLDARYPIETLELATHSPARHTQGRALGRALATVAPLGHPQIPLQVDLHLPDTVRSPAECRRVLGDLVDGLFSSPHVRRAPLPLLVGCIESVSWAFIGCAIHCFAQVALPAEAVPFSRSALLYGAVVIGMFFHTSRAHQTGAFRPLRVTLNRVPLFELDQAWGGWDAPIAMVPRVRVPDSAQFPAISR